ncbi:MAG: methyl acetate hydrolase, partial [Acidobacteriaceae bacterium]|nr:methyl acetate hydrolase [Acidobacteriaceae bacterium]
RSICWHTQRYHDIPGHLHEQAVGATAAAILADRGILDSDTPVEDILPNFGKLTVLVSFDKKNAQLRQPATRATLRHLATHTSGLFYGFWDEQIAQYLEANGKPPVVSGLRASLACPLVFDPEDRWQYGSGVDWLGLVAEALDGRSIRQFCHEEIFDPLRMPDTRFE